MTKSNDDIPADELLLAEAIAAAKARGLGWCKGSRFKDAQGNWVTSPTFAHNCCALGALEIAGRIRPQGEDDNDDVVVTSDVAHGNDRGERWSVYDSDHGESLGWAFRCAMTQEEP